MIMKVIITINIIFFCFGILMFCSPNLDEEAFFDLVAGDYTLTATGAGFIKREMKDVITDNVSPGDTLQLRADGSLSIIFSATSSVLLAQYVELKLEDQAVFELAGANQFIALGKKDILLIATTNGEPSAGAVLFEHLVPIAIEK